MIFLQMYAPEKMKRYLSIQENFDKADINAENIRVTQEEIDEAYAQVDTGFTGCY